MSTLPLHVRKGHLFLESGDALWLIDTGAPTSFGSQSKLALAGKHFRLGKDYLGLTAATLSGFVNVDCAGLLGNDVLGQFDMLLDAPNGTVDLSVAELRHSGQPIKLDEFTDIPIVTTRIHGAEYRMIFDTGAQISYFQHGSLSDFPPVGVITDFYPGVGQFETKTHIVDIQLGGIDLSLRCGTLPEELWDRFRKTGTTGIVGNEIVRTRQVGYFLRRRLLVLYGKNLEVNMNRFESLSRLADRKTWCDDLYCWCGHYELRYGLKWLAQGLYPDGPGWGKTWNSGPAWQFDERPDEADQRAIQDAVRGCKLTRLAQTVSFPYWLNHLELVLYWTQDAERQNLLLTRELVPQFVRLVRPGSEADAMLRERLPVAGASLNRPLCWDDLWCIKANYSGPLAWYHNHPPDLSHENAWNAQSRWDSQRSWEAWDLQHPRKDPEWTARQWSRGVFPTKI